MKHGEGNDSPAFNPILQTKLHRPQLSGDVVYRNRLIKLMNRARDVPLTLVSAPAGYGKSVLVTQWIEQLDCPIAWLSLDDDDSDLMSFVEYFVAAVNTVVPGACDATHELLQASSAPPISVLANSLLNDLDAIDTPCAIVLDDYHLIEPVSPVQDLMRSMLAHPPRQFRFILITRHDPPLDLPGLRAGHRINDVRLQDLRFSATESNEFLNVTQEHAIGDEAMKTLDREVEGWAAGLRLLVLAMRHVADPDAFLKTLHGGLPQIQDYLLHEVLSAQDAQARDCLLASSILDRFCVDLLDAVCTAPDINEHAEFTAIDFLDELLKDNLFTFSLDAERKWFRYHHLFQGLLFSELQRAYDADHVSDLHLLASQWFENEGLIDEAIEHTMATGDMKRAAALIARHRHTALDADRWYDLDHWLSLIPETVLQQHAELLVSHAWILMNHLQTFEPVPALLDRAASLLGDEQNHDKDMEPIRGELALCRGYMLWLKGDGAECLKHLEVALQKIPVSHVEVRSHAEIMFASATQMIGNDQQAIRFLDDQFLHSGLHSLRKSRLLFSYVVIHLLAGDLPAAKLAAQQLRRFVARGESVYALAWSDYLVGLIHLSHCEWEAAIEYLGRAVKRRFIHNRRAATDSMLGLMLAYHALGREDEARSTMQIMQEFVSSVGESTMRVAEASVEARLAILQEQIKSASPWPHSSEPPAEGNLLWWIDIPLVTRFRTMIAVGSADQLAHAVMRLRECIEANESQHNTYQLINVLTLLAMAYEKQGNTEQALDVLERAMTMAGKGDLFLPFVELGIPMVDLLNKLSPESEFVIKVEQLVNAFGLPSSSSTVGEVGAGKPSVQKHDGQYMVVEGNLENLTNRELDILELLTQRLQNKEIAARLNISHHTVDSHLKQIYQKLGVHGRRKAAEEAIRTGILERAPSH